MIDAEEEVLLVDVHDRPLGHHAKLDAHRRGLRHRAFSVFLTDSAGQAILQRRSLSKYHSGGQWSNACCGHPRAGETNGDAARRRLREEMGIDAALRPVGRLTYSAALPGGWFENEIVHLFTGQTHANLRPDPAEVAEIRSIGPDLLLDELTRSPDHFTIWFRIYAESIRELALGGLRDAA